MQRRVVVVGAGVAGMSAAWRIRERARQSQVDIDLTVLEASARTGGKIDSHVDEGYLCESGPNGFLDNEPATLRLVDDLGLREDLQRSTDASRRRFLVRGGQLVEMSMNPVKFLKSSLLSRRAKWLTCWSRTLVAHCRGTLTIPIRIRSCRNRNCAVG